MVVQHDATIIAHHQFRPNIRAWISFWALLVALQAELDKASAAAVQLESLRGELAQLQLQQQEADKLQSKISNKVTALRERAKCLEALHTDKKQLEEQVTVGIIG